jgi:hypothetical protein
VTLSLLRGGHSSVRADDVNGEEKRKVENFFLGDGLSEYAKFFTSQKFFVRKTTRFARMRNRNVLKNLKLTGFARGNANCGGAAFR